MIKGEIGPARFVDWTVSEDWVVHCPCSYNRTEDIHGDLSNLCGLPCPSCGKIVDVIRLTPEWLAKKAENCSDRKNNKIISF
jgi:hypothetical protein